MTNPALATLDFSLSDQDEPSTGLVSVTATEDELAKLRADERAAVLDAAAFKHVHFVFFRRFDRSQPSRFDDNRSSHVAAYVTDNSNAELSEADLAKVHHHLWINGTAPLWYVAGSTRVDIFSCARKPDFWDEATGKEKYKPAERIEIAASIDQELRRRYSAYRLADGTFWDDPANALLAKHDQAAHKSLIQAIVETDEALDGKNHPSRRRLLLLMVLVKYLEDRKVFPNEGWFGTHFHPGARSFIDLLRSEEPDCVEKFLRFMEDRFNGDIFRAPGGGDWNLSRTELRTFCSLVAANTLGQQMYFWKQFDFEHLPVEVISHLYERFVHAESDDASAGSRKGKVYTPPILANLILDQVMPYGQLTGRERILDPACGSGVFLVGAFRRLVVAWRSHNNWEKPSVDTLEQILHDSIFGVDLDAGALDLAAFSLALGICDALLPEIIWKYLKFKPLRGRNLVESDFFDLMLRKRAGSPTILGDGFDIVVGNPPFESKLTDAGIKLESLARTQRTQGDVNTSATIGLPDKQAAYLFLEQTAHVLRPNGKACLLQPSGFLYNRNPRSIRRWFFESRTVVSVYDVTSIRGLFDGADTKAVSICCTPSPPMEDHFLTHVTFRRTVSINERVAFEVDHYDWQRLPQQRAASDPFVWRLNLLGGGRLHEISLRLRSLRTLGDFLAKQVSERGWDYGEGFIAGTTGNRHPADFLMGLRLLPTGAFNEDGLDKEQIVTVEDTQFKSAYTIDRYTAPLVLIKESAALPIQFWDDGPIAYRDKIIGIHAPRNDASALRQMYQRIESRRKTYMFSLALHGSQAMVGKATAILKQDIDVLPFPDDEADMNLADWEEAIQDDILKYMVEFVRLGQHSKLLRNQATLADLGEYARMYVRMLGSVYRNLRAEAPAFLDGLICQPFCFGTESSSEWLQQSDRVTERLRQLVHTEQSPTLRSVRVVRFYDTNTIFIVKPDRLRYWIRSTAIRDADDTLVELQRQGW